MSDTNTVTWTPSPNFDAVWDGSFGRLAMSLVHFPQGFWTFSCVPFFRHVRIEIESADDAKREAERLVRNELRAMLGESWTMLALTAAILDELLTGFEPEKCQDGVTYFPGLSGAAMRRAGELRGRIRG